MPDVPKGTKLFKYIQSVALPADQLQVETTNGRHCEEMRKEIHSLATIKNRE